MSIQTKHFLNSPDTLVVDALSGLCALNPALSFDRDNKIVHLAKQDRSKVALFCGGGSGHEPAHSGFVGDGVLTAAVCGNIFASPNASQVRRAIDLVHNEKGTVIIVKNYTGDVLNFGLAKEQYAASHPDFANRVKFVIVGDDVAVGRTQGSIVGRRGLAGTVLVYKIAGALAHRGGSLDDVYNIAQWTANRVATIGVGLEHCHVPGTAAASSHLSNSEIEIGMGIHNEAGNKRISMPPLSELMPQLLDLIMNQDDEERSFVPFQGSGKDKVVLLVNNLGGISELELSGIVSEAKVALGKRGVGIERVLSGSFMTSLNMPGFSITLLLLPNQSNGPDSSHILSLLDDPTSAPGWKFSSHVAPPSELTLTTPSTASTTKATHHPIPAPSPETFVSSLTSACKALIAAEPQITSYDNIAGDGDCGLTLQSGANAVLSSISSSLISGSDVVGSIIQIAKVAEEKMGGTSGALYSIWFSALAQGLQQVAARDGVKEITRDVWVEALKGALEKLFTYTRARPPSRTLVDPLAAFVGALEKGQEGSWKKAVEKAAEAAEKTRELEAKAGRSAYVEGDRLKEENVPDPGAWGVKIILEGLGL
ncbi:hypothetical protein D9758_015092 [Tetrapyrgos nigripes]|uniref:Dihydroxyacetone kinase n=1 Tax=Tetrapyrgos nigripes TaxID=182062 RepID=A0A8H5FHK5_9AGAR|nr:hypothetical protein D9758_015092 [Tetrapyrgos nigripes]